ncbi:histidine phosphatase family protein [Alloscardovia theropitheci]|uniref:histidine phosphatase family protein n=1 Tax=Alloscardovia theropitheci TaxID=2496842 RepID=UPI0023EA6E2A|nr:histidine phosphatase family protein [Alloscardovia theropitheci]
MQRPGHLILLRHGQTMWSETGQYTGRTNIPLTHEGENQARLAGERLASSGLAIENENVFVSPLMRAQKTAQLAGFEGYNTEFNLSEFDYGPAEGRTRFEVAEALGIDAWNIWDIGPLQLPSSLQGKRSEHIDDFGDVEINSGVGESSEQAAQRVRSVIEDVLPRLESGKNVLCVAHAHILRILTTQWLGLEPNQARCFQLDTAKFCVLGWHHSDHVIENWNM